jgi:hypothetical protein
VSAEPKIFDYADFPYSEQFFTIERVVDRGNDKHEEEIVYGVTSLKRGEASAKKLLRLNREHWGIENKVHYVRDMAYDEDRCRVRVKNGPRVMASIRNLVIGIFRLLGFRYVASAIRYYCFNPDLEETLAILGI